MEGALKVVHIIVGLDAGGAELMLFRLVVRLAGRGISSEVWSLTETGPVGARMRERGVAVKALGLQMPLPSPLGALRLAAWLRLARPDLVHTWMPHANLVGGLVARALHRAPIVWGIRNSKLDPNKTKKTTLWATNACAKLSGWVPTRIACVSQASRIAHTDLGYSSDKMVVIPNGFDPDHAIDAEQARQSVRAELKVAGDAVLVGLVGRFNPLKDHATFFRAAQQVGRARSDVHFVLCGAEIDAGNRELARLVAPTGLDGRVHLLGRRPDVMRLHAACDLGCSSSYSEGFPNVIGEAMLVGVPCVVTDAGDSADIVGDTGKIVSPRDPDALASGLLSLLSLDPDERKALGERARKRIEERFSLEAIVGRYESLYRELVPCAE